MPPRAVSSTAASTRGFISTLRALLRPAAIAVVDAAAGDVDAVGAGHAHATAGAREHVGDQPRRRRLAVDAGDGDDRNAAVLSAGKQRFDDRFADRSRRAGRRLQVHPQPGLGVDFDDHAALVVERLADVVGDDVDAGDVEPDHPGRFDGLPRHVGMDPIGDVGRRAAGAQVRVAADEDLAAGGRNRIGREALFGQHRQGNAVDLDRAQDGGVAVAAARIAIDLVDQLPNGGSAVADDVGRLALGGRDHPLVDHQQAVVVARHEPLDHDGRALSSTAAS